MSDTKPEIHALLKQERGPKRKLIIAAVIIATVALLTLLFRGEEQKTPKFITAAVERGDLIITVTATGTLAPLNQVDVGSELSGRIETVNADFNDRVKRGQVLARINTDEQRARVVQARATLEVADARVLQASATVQETRLKLDRCVTLAQQGLCPPQDMDSVRAAHDRAAADLASAKAQVSQAKATLDAESSRLDKAVIRSPIDGIVLKRSIEPGQTVAASLQAPVLFTLAENLRQMELRVAVDEADIGQIHNGQEATFTVDAYGERTFPARITQVRLAPQTTAGVVSYETILSLDNQALLLRPGMTATARIVVEEIRDALLIPNTALRFTPPVMAEEKRGFMEQLFPRWGGRDQKERGEHKQKQVWTLKDQQPVAVSVKTGASDGRMTQLIEGDLDAGQELLVDVANGAEK